jgi:hypothetical protein
VTHNTARGLRLSWVAEKPFTTSYPCNCMFHRARPLALSITI